MHSDILLEYFILLYYSDGCYSHTIERRDNRNRRIIRGTAIIVTFLLLLSALSLIVLYVRKCVRQRELAGGGLVFYRFYSVQHSMRSTKSV